MFEIKIKDFEFKGKNTSLSAPAVETTATATGGVKNPDLPPHNLTLPPPVVLPLILIQQKPIKHMAESSSHDPHSSPSGSGGRDRHLRFWWREKSKLSTP